MRAQLIQRLPTETVKTGGMWCALSSSLRSDSSVLRLSYLGSKETVIATSHQASAFTARNPRNPEADHKAALD